MNVSTPNSTVELCLTTISYVRASPSKFYTLHVTLACIMNCLLFVIGTLVNGLVLIAFLKSNVLRSKTPFFLIMLLSLNDFAVVFMVHPLFLYNSIKQLLGNGNCLPKAVYLTIAKLLTGYSGLTLHVMNIERYISIAHPFWYQRVTPRAALVGTVVLWAFWTPVPFTAFIDGAIQRIILSISSAIVCLTIIFVYGRIFHIARKKRRTVPAVSVIELTVRPDSATREELEKTPERTRSKMGEVIKDIKLAKMFIILVICSQVCYLPNIAYHTYLRMQNTEIKTESSLVMGNWVVTFISMNSTLNSLIFFWKNSQLRKEILQIIKPQ